MPRRSRIHTGQFVYHALNRAVEGVTLFHSARAYAHFLRLASEAMDRVPIRLLAYCVMPNHWHMVLWPPEDGALACFMKCLTATHAQEWRRQHGSVGRGAVYQGRYKAIAVQDGRHLVQLCRYVERNPLRAKLAALAQDWEWSSASPGATQPHRPELSPWPVPRPPDWLALLNEPEPPAVLEQIREAVRRTRHLGVPSWRIQAADRLEWRAGLRGPGRTRLDLPV